MVDIGHVLKKTAGVGIRGNYKKQRNFKTDDTMLILLETLENQEVLLQWMIEQKNVEKLN